MNLIALYRYAKVFALFLVTFLHKGKHGCNFLLHFFPGLELNDGSGRNRDVFGRIFWISPYFCFGDFDLKGAEISHHNGIAFSEIGCDFIESLLNDVKDLLLGKTSKVADTVNEVSFGDCCHGDLVVVCV